MFEQAVRLDRYELAARRELNRILIKDADFRARRQVETQLQDPHCEEFIDSLRNPHEID